MNADAIVRLVLELIVAAGGGATIAYVLTLRQRRELLTAQASSTEDTGSALIMAEAAKIVGNAADLVPVLVERVTRLEAARDTMGSELDDVYRFADEAYRWMGNAVRIIAELGGSIAPPPDVPARRVFPRTMPSAAATTQS